MVSEAEGAFLPFLESSEYAHAISEQPVIVASIDAKPPQMPHRGLSSGGAPQRPPSRGTGSRVGRVTYPAE